jgi:trimeric autotransporter adhesin
MKKLVLLFAILNIKNFVVAQVGIGTSTPNANAALDVQSANKGLLIPRVDLVALTTNSLSTFGVSATPTISLLVYNTTASTLPSTIFQTGYYYWDGANWIKLNTGATSSAATGWSVTGNSGTNPAANFIGTVDNQPLRFKVNNFVAGQIGVNNNTSLGGSSHILFGGSENTGIGGFALALTTGNGNVGVGFSSLYSNVTGANNTAVGSNALSDNVSGYSNVAVGVSALKGNTAINNLVAIGDSALRSNGIGANLLEGIQNTATGSKALMNNTKGSFNTSTGYNALMKNTIGYGNTAVGSQSMNENITGVNNTASGAVALALNTTGSNNTANGALALYENNIGVNNTAIGTNALKNNAQGNSNTAIGVNALLNNTLGEFNLGLGINANVGQNNLTNATAIGAKSFVNCSNCLVLGSVNGVNTATSDTKVGIGTSSPTSPLSFASTSGKKISLYQSSTGDIGMGIGPFEYRMFTDNASANIVFGHDNFINGFNENVKFFGNGNIHVGNYTAWSNTNDNRRINFGDGDYVYLGEVGADDRLELRATSFNFKDGNVFIGTNNFTSGAGYKLRVGGKIFSEEVRVQLQSAWPDYVFEKNYSRMTLSELEDYINENKHLPNIPSATEVEKNGQHLGEIQRKMLEKIEELSLYIIELKNEIDLLKLKK